MAPKRFALAMLAGMAAIAASVPACAADPMSEMLTKALAKDRVEESVREALGKLGERRCGDGPCAPTDEAELTNPPVSLDEAREAMRAGIRSAVLDWCDLDWESRSLGPMLEKVGAGSPLDGRRRTLLATIHYGEHGPVVEALRAGGPCPERMKLNLERPLFGDPRSIGIGPGDPVPGVIETEGRDGLTPETAVVVAPASTGNAPVRTQTIWIGRRHPDGRRAGIEPVPRDGRRIERVDVDRAEGGRISYYFDVGPVIEPAR